MMKQQKFYTFFQKQIMVVIWLSMAPGLVYVFFGYIYGVFIQALLWYAAIGLNSFYGMHLYRQFEQKKMDHHELKKWYEQLIVFMYIMFSLWTVIFILYSQETENNLHYIAIFTQLGSSVVASALLVSDKKFFIPILFILMVPLIFYFGLIGSWYGYVLALFSTILLGVLLYASNNTYTLIQTNYFNAQHDALTGLHNRRYFIDYMDSLVERLNVTRKSAYILLIDLDHFKTINDSLGHDVGDMVLKEVGERIRNFCRLSHVVARLGGDEFVVVSREFHSNEASVSEIKVFAEKLLASLKEPYVVDNHHLYLSASIGLSKIEDEFIDGNSFLKEADIAMYEAKASGRDGVILFNKALAARVERKLQIEQRLHHALKHETLTICYQPQVDNQRRLIGCEVLVRWDDETLGKVEPNEFIPIAENTGLIIELGRYVLKKSLETLREWTHQGMDIEQFAINISVRQLFYGFFIRDVKELLENCLDEACRKKIIFEITESVLAEDIEKVTKILLQLKALGISFSMDDFGTGYSSLNYLRTLPVDELKIDRTFVHHLLESGPDKMMVTTMISIARNFGLKVVVEGVESQEQFDFLIDYQCYAYQGFYFAKPLDKKTFEAQYLRAVHHT